MSKVPAKRISCDSIVIKIGEETYRTHEGEYVEIVGGPSWQFMRDVAEMTRLESLPFSQMTDEDSKATVQTLDRLMEFLSSRIVAWNWTDNKGTPLPEPSAEILAKLEQYEVLWLIQAVRLGSDPVQAEESEKNA